MSRNIMYCLMSLVCMLSYAIPVLCVESTETAISLSGASKTIKETAKGAGETAEEAGEEVKGGAETAYDKSKESVTSTGKVVKDVVEEGGKFVAKTLKAAYEFLKEESQEAWDKLKELEKLKKYLDKLLDLLKGFGVDQVVAEISGIEMEKGKLAKMTIKLTSGKSITFDVRSNDLADIAKKIADEVVKV